MSGAGGPGGVPVAPNKAAITARVLSTGEDPAMPGRWLLELDIAASTPLEGTDWAALRPRSQAFVVGAPPDVGAGDTIEAEATWLGGPTGGRFRLEKLRRKD